MNLKELRNLCFKEQDNYMAICYGEEQFERFIVQMSFDTEEEKVWIFNTFSNQEIEDYKLENYGVEAIYRLIDTPETIFLQ